MAHIAIEVRGGSVETIRCNDPDVRVTLIDWDEAQLPGAELPAWALEDAGQAISRDVFPTFSIQGGHVRLDRAVVRTPVGHARDTDD